MKTPDLNKPAFQLHPEKANAIREQICPLCHKAINGRDFKDELSKKEYAISGMCVVCQGKVFGDDQ